MISTWAVWLVAGLGFVLWLAIALVVTGSLGKALGAQQEEDDFRSGKRWIWK